MALRTRAYDFLFYAVIGTIYAFSLSLSVLSATVLEVGTGALLSATAVFVILFYLVFFNRYTSYTVLGVLAVLSIAGCISMLVTKFEAQWFLSLKAFVTQVVLITQKRVPDVAQYSDAFAIAFSAVFAFLTALNMRVTFNFAVLAVMGVAVTSIPVFMQWGQSDLGAGLFVLCLVVLLCKSMNLQAAEEGKDGRKTNARFALAAIPACLLLLGISWLLPKPEQLLENLAAPERIREAADNMIYDLGADQTQSFTEPGETLGGPVELNDMQIMEVYADERVLLSGSVRDTYTGTAWTVSDKSASALSPDGEDWFSASEYSDVLLENQLYYMRYYDRQVRSLQINMMGNRTKTIFTAPFKTGLGISSEYTPGMDRYGAVTLGKPLERYGSFTQEYISWNWNNPYFTAYVLQADGGNDNLPAEYLDLPDSLPDRVGELAAQITAGYSNGYEKMSAISSWLQRFPYTLEPESVPRGEDFVDYFLFEGQEGYCVYFATALAVMGRTQGIPTRYVEGYVMPRERNANGAYAVTGKYAHAWTEVYSPGFGWVPMDPTPGLYLDVAAGEQVANQPEPVEEPEPEERPDQVEPEPEPVPDPDPEDPEAEDPVISEPEQPEEEEPVAGMNPIPVTLLATVLIVVLSALFVKAMMHRYRTRFGKLDQMDNREAAEAYFSRFLMAAEVYGFPLLRGETAHAYAGRVGGELALDRASDLRELADIYARASYSPQEISDGERLTMKRAYLELVAKLREGKRKGIKYYIDRYILMRF